MTASGPAYEIGQQVLRRGGRVVLDRQATLDIAGAEHIPASGPCVIVARHYHNLLDGCALYAATGRSLHILVGLDWAGTGLLRRVMEKLSRMVAWPIILRPDALDREAAAPKRKSEARRLLRAATRDGVDLLAAGKVVVMFPEGYPVVDPHAKTQRASPEGVVPFQPGVVRLVRIAERRLGREIPLVPVGFAYEQRDDGRWEIAMRIGPPLSREGLESDTELLRVLESQVAALSGIPVPARTRVASEQNVSR
ncbi:MAG TPA: 1-acyl-sn-glycerol-3-phosphate acyltransferase [Thermomicrobiales bacterium]|nr:1-acyl-sn-glycerol-3-phosphate acyltransferase [Thermomicrobiales bacterium]